ncbi:MAG: metallophosphoesterase [Candidatus Didemnitutus sp.]|nr:metallophosphoesterase [Candidatus Didemnitutus sp.]
MSLPPLTRRAFLAAAAGVPLTLLYTWRIEPHWLEITERDLPIRHLPPHLAGRTLAHFSDLHIGRDVDPDYIAETFRRIAARRPDIVVQTGDLITASGASGLAEVRRLLAAFPRGSLGSYAVLGNHDYGHNWSHADEADAVTAELTRAGVQVLRNAQADCAGLRLVGFDDLWAGRFDPARALAGLPADAPALALCHNPDACDLPGWENFRSWILAGHTHGGQCKPPFLPPPILPVKNRRYTSGAFTLAGDRQLYISRGVGHLMRVRFNVRPEVALFTLRRA